MTQKHIQKLENLQLDIASLKAKAAEIETALAQEMVSIFREINAFSMDFDVLVGGMLEVIHKTKTNAPEQEVWRHAGLKFRKRFRKLLTKKEAGCDVA
jgi:hypothetical protein